MRILLVMGDYRVTTDGAWVDLWYGSELAQTIPALYFPEKTADRVELVTEMVHGGESHSEVDCGDRTRGPQGSSG